jgi:transposase-like protein
MRPTFPAATPFLRLAFCHLSPYLNNIIEQEHRFIKIRITASLGFRS